MAEELRCPHCGAPYKKKVPEWVSNVLCAHCGTTILLPKKETNSQMSKVVYVEEITKSQKSFCLSDFCEFMRKKGYLLDPVSGLLKMGSTTLNISEDGVVDGPEPFKSRAERWISEYMKT